MKQIIQKIIFITGLALLFACSDASDTALSTNNSPAKKADTEKLNLSLPEEIITDQTTTMTIEPPLLPELFNQEKETSKYQLDGQALFKEKAALGTEAFDGAKVSITIKQ